jgi:hypothetical protein
MSTRYFKNKTSPLQTIFIFLLLILLLGCAGTIQTTHYSNSSKAKYKKAYIISAENSQYIKFKFGIITPFGIIILPDDPAKKHEIIGNTDIVIKEELEKYGIVAEIGKKGDSPEGFDVIVEYQDTWRWDFKKTLDKLEIVFISPLGDTVMSRSTYNIYKNKELHDFPTPKKEVPKMIKELLNK